MHRNELNYWNGKVQNMRRDMELQQNYNMKMQQELRDLRQCLDESNRSIALGKSREVTMERQIQGLEEDNARLAKMYEQLTSAPATQVNCKDPSPTFLACKVQETKAEEESTPGKAQNRFTSVSKEFGGASFASKRSDY